MDNIMNNTTSLQDILTLLEDKAAGAVLPTLDNPAGADQVFAGYEVIDGSGAVVEGTFTIDAELSAQDGLIAQIQAALEGKASVSAVLQEKTATPTESPQEITADDGYDGLGKVTVEAIPSDYVVPSGTKNITENGTHDVKNYASVSVEVETGGAADPVLQDKTVNPKFSRQIITADEGYDGLGTVTVNGMDEDYIIPSGTLEITENGKHDVEEYKYVNVNVASSGGGGGADLGALLSNTLTVLDNSDATSLRQRACQQATKLETVNLPNVTSVGQYAFYNCSGLATVKLPKATSIPSQCFYSCSKLVYCDVGQASSIAAQAFNACSALATLIIRRTGAICVLSNTSAISNSGIATGKGYVYVPAALVASYKSNSVWSTYANQIRAIEDYPDICGA